MIEPLEVPVLRGRLVRLELLDHRHVDELVEAATEDRTSYGYTTVPVGAELMHDYVADAIAGYVRGEVVPFAQVSEVAGRVLGATRYLNIRRLETGELPYAVEIGATWLGPSAQGTGVNAEAKLLLLKHAFDVWGVGRVDLKTDARNERSRTAIAALGATFEGVLRSWQPSHAAGELGSLRDSAIYSIVTVEWPGVRERLEERVARHL
jgi:RimJ/RimL family protein N-acetyltransferase